MSESFSLAIAKGRVLEEVVGLLEVAGFPATALKGGSRKLVFDLPGAGPSCSSGSPAALAGLRVLVVRSQDVPTYVRRGAADGGIVGKDVIEEQDTGLYEPLDLGISRCRLVVAGPKGRGSRASGALSIAPLRIATKYPRLARAHFLSQGLRTDIVHLYGAIELAPLTGIADKIVDLVDTGKTLKANGLAEEAVVLESTARLVIGRASLRVKSQAARELIGRLSAATKRRGR